MIKVEKRSAGIFVIRSSSLLRLEPPRLTRDAKGSEAHSDHGTIRVYLRVTKPPGLGISRGLRHVFVGLCVPVL